MGKIKVIKLPLTAAYKFGKSHNLASEIEAIRQMKIVWDKTYKSSLRSAYIIELFEKHNIYQAFKDTCWPDGNSGSGNLKRLWYFKLQSQQRNYARSHICEVNLGGKLNKNNQELGQSETLDQSMSPCPVLFFKSHNILLKKRIANFLELALTNSSDAFLLGILLDRFLWTATEDNDKNERVKYIGQPYWSKEAILQYQRQNQGRKNKYIKNLRHEHIVPRNIIKKRILGLPIKSAENIFKILESCSHAVIVTKKEDQRLKDVGLNKDMPESFHKDGNIKARYQAAGIEIREVTGQNLKKIML